MADRVEIDVDENEVRADRTVREWGGSHVVALPPQLLDAAGLEQGDRVRLRASMDNGTIEISELDLDAIEDPEDEEG